MLSVSAIPVKLEYIPVAAPSTSTRLRSVGGSVLKVSSTAYIGAHSPDTMLFSSSTSFDASATLLNDDSCADSAKAEADS